MSITTISTYVDAPLKTFAAIVKEHQQDTDPISQELAHCALELLTLCLQQAPNYNDLLEKVNNLATLLTDPSDSTLYRDPCLVEDVVLMEKSVVNHFDVDVRPHVFAQKVILWMSSLPLKFPLRTEDAQVLPCHYIMIEQAKRMRQCIQKITHLEMVCQTLEQVNCNEFQRFEQLIEEQMQSQQNYMENMELKIEGIEKMHRESENDYQKSMQQTQSLLNSVQNQLQDAECRLSHQQKQINDIHAQLNASNAEIDRLRCKLDDSCVIG